MEIKSHFKYKFILIPRRVAVYVTQVFYNNPLATRHARGLTVPSNKKIVFPNFIVTMNVLFAVYKRRCKNTTF